LFIINLMKKILLFLSAVFFFTPFFTAVDAASFSFDKSSYSVAVGQTIQVQVNIDAGNEEVNGADVYIDYDASFLSVENVSAGSFFPTVINDTATAGKVYITGLVEDQASPKTGSGVLATITFKGINNGVVNLSFDCANSKIVKNDVNVTNILECSSSSAASVVVGSGDADSSTSSTGTSSTGSQSTGLPKSGIFDNLINLAIPGVVLFLIGSGLRFFLLK